MSDKAVDNLKLTEVSSIMVVMSKTEQTPTSTPEQTPQATPEQAPVSKDQSLRHKPKRTQGSASNKKTEYITPSGIIVALTPQQKAYADLKLAAPQTSLTEIAQQAYPNVTRETARQVAVQNERHEGIAIYTSEQLSKAKKRVVELVESRNERVALSASQDIINRVEGMPVQRNVNHTASVSITIAI